jgi:hypothetical protein
VQANTLKATTLFLCLVLTAPPVQAQGSPPRPEARSPLSEIAHDVSTWLGRLTGTGPGKNRSAPPPPLPRPRPIQPPATMASQTEPAQLAPTPVLPNKEPEALAHGPIASKKNASAPVLIND